MIPPRLAGACGIAGSATVALGCTLAALPYRGRIGELYTPWNHFVSELGEVGVSEGAGWFNGGLVLGGACFVLFMAGLPSLDRRPIMRLAAALGMFSGLCATVVGLVPMNWLMPHLAMAAVFFHAGLAAVALVTVATWRGRSLPRSLAWLALPALVSFAALVAMIPLSGFDPSDLPFDERRPAVWSLTIVEWIVVATALGWIAAVGVAMLARRAAHGDEES